MSHLSVVLSAQCMGEVGGRCTVNALSHVLRLCVVVCAQCMGEVRRTANALPHV